MFGILKNKKIYCSLLSSIFSLMLINTAKSEPVMGFEAKSDLKIGPILKMGFPVLGSGSNVSYSPNISLDIRGESFIFGTTGFNFNWLSSTRTFIDLNSGKSTFSQVSPNSSKKITKNLLLLTLVSPINFAPETKFEYGWQGGIFSQFVSLDTNLGGDTNSNIGINAGMYIKDYHLYPFVPYINGKILLGNMYDNGKTYQQHTLSSSIKSGYIGSLGFELYISKQVVINVGYNIINPDFFTLSPTKGTVQSTASTTGTTSSNQPADDTTFSFDENVQTVNASLGFLF